MSCVSVNTHENVESTFKDLKMGKKVTLRYMVLKMDEGKVVVEKSGGIDASLQNADEKEKRKKTYDEFVKVLPPNDCRFAAIDCDKTIYFVLWTPDNAHVKQKMSYTSSKESMKGKLPGCDGTTIEAHEIGDLERLLF